MKERKNNLDLNYYSDRNLLKDFLTIKINCPNCLNVGYIKDDIFLRKSQIIKIFGETEKGNPIFEIANLNCYCSMCKDVSRLSNGTMIKRKRRWVEIPPHIIKGVGLVLIPLSMFLTFFPMIVKIEPENLLEDGYAKYLVWGGLGLLGLICLLHLKAILYPSITIFKYREDIKTLNNEIEIKTREEIEGQNYLQNQLKELLKKKDEQIRKSTRLIMSIIPVFSFEKKLKKFDKEKELQLFIANNISSFRFKGRSVNVYSEQHPNEGIEFYTSVGRIDLLLIDEVGDLIVIETKLDKAPDKTMGQISRYLGWVKKELATKNQKVYGIIIGHNIGEKLKYATENYENIYLLEYDLGLNLKNIKL